ncbi:hypothetical protein B7494_g2726 [Chlorociboria aeruginascens]|nr:hypothetical protein B7494_g2726 [Chlorociboria aeruginascens]
MATTRVNRIPIIVAVLTIIFLIALWHSRDSLPGQPLHYIKGTFSPRPSFYDIALKYGTDKVTTHHYELMYTPMLDPLRDRPLKMLEIGLGCNMNYGPGASYHTWLEFLPYVDLYYIEYDADCAAKWANSTTGATIFPGDQADVGFLQKFLEESGGDFDVIIDDGGHTMVQQKTSLDILWSSVKPGGLYFIEDLGTSYVPGFGGGWLKEDTMMEDIKRVLDDINRMEPGVTKYGKEVQKVVFVQEVVCLVKVGEVYP